MKETPDASERAVHHSLLNHVAVASTYAHLIADSNLDVEQREMLDELLSSIEEAHVLATELGERLGFHHGSGDRPTESTGGSS